MLMFVEVIFFLIGLVLINYLTLIPQLQTQWLWKLQSPPVHNGSSRIWATLVYFFYSGRKWRCFASLYMSVVPTIISCQLKMAAKIATMTCNKVNKKVNEGTDLCVFTQVDPFGDVVDGGDPLMEEAAERRCKDMTEQLTAVNTEQGNVTEKHFTSSQSFLLSDCRVTTLTEQDKCVHFMLSHKYNMKTWNTVFMSPLTSCHRRKWPGNRSGGRHSRPP